MHAVLTAVCERRALCPLPGYPPRRVNDVVGSKPVIGQTHWYKKQLIRWNRWTAQPFLDVRVAVLDGTLENLFRTIYPEFRPANDTGQVSAVA